MFGLAMKTKMEEVGKMSKAIAHHYQVKKMSKSKIRLSKDIGVVLEECHNLDMYVSCTYGNFWYYSTCKCSESKIEVNETFIKDGDLCTVKAFEEALKELEEDLMYILSL